MKNDTFFSPAFGNRPAFLVGRDATLDSLTRGLQSFPGSRERSVVLLGQRGSGKTVLLWELFDRAQKYGFVVASPTVAADGMLERIVEKIQDNGEKLLRNRQTHLTGATLGALGFTVGLEFQRDIQETKSAEHRLTQLARALSSQGLGLLILIDELQANSLDVRRLVVAYQELVGEGLDVALVMAGLPAAVSATLNDHVLTFLNRANKTTLPPLKIADIDAYYAEAFGSLDIEIGDDDRMRLAEATKGSPYMMQLIGHNIVMRADSSGAISMPALERSMSLAAADFENDVCETTLATLSDRDRDFLCAMAVGDCPAAIADVVERMGEKPDYVQKYRRRLIGAGVIEATSRGHVDFAVPYLHDHLRKSC